MKPSVDVSVIMPTFRRPDYLGEALKSILRVDTLSIEIMVIDDSPDAEGRDVAAAFGDDRIRYSKRDLPTQGRPALLRNDAARMASGSVLYFLDDDDRVVPEALPQAHATLRGSRHGVLLTLPRPFGANAAKVQSEIAYYERAKTILKRTPSALELDARLTFTSSFVVPSACLIRRNVFDKVGGFPEDFAFCEDVDLFARAIASDGYVFADMTLVERRVGHSSLIAEAKTEALRHSYHQLRQGFRSRRGTLAYLANRIKYRLSDS